MIIWPSRDSIKLLDPLGVIHILYEEQIRLHIFEVTCHYMGSIKRKDVLCPLSQIQRILSDIFYSKGSDNSHEN